MLGLLGGSSCAAGLPWSVDPDTHRRVAPERSIVSMGGPARTFAERVHWGTTPASVSVRIPELEQAVASAVALPSIDCTIRRTTGYRRGKPLPLQLVRVAGETVEQKTANAFVAMYRAAAADGIHLAIRSAFRTMRAQRWLYRCYRTCSCNGCNKAAKPGYSNHQSGRALDLVLSSPKVRSWLVRNAGTFGFRATVRGEPWHWVYGGSSDFPDVCDGRVGLEPGETSQSL